jgi:hypothetical protein
VACSARNGEIFVNVRASLVEEESLTKKVSSIAEKVEGVKRIRVNVVPFVIED